MSSEAEAGSGRCGAAWFSDRCGIDLEVPVPPVDITRARTERVRRIERVDVLGGLLHEYRPAA